MNDSHRMFKKALQRGRSTRRGESYVVGYVEPRSDARTKLQAFFNILLVNQRGFVRFHHRRHNVDQCRRGVQHGNTFQLHAFRLAQLL
ncbi:MAG: hypothetical protein K0S58_1017 [Nitrospira sp.]|nr:hypothetical protein [Nitrospira sp.]